MRQAAVPQQHLVASEGWDYFLSLVQERIETLEKERPAILELLVAPYTSTTENLWGLRCDAIRNATELKAWRTVIGLPKQIIENADAAKAAMRKLSEPSGESNER